MTRKGPRVCGRGEKGCGVVAHAGACVSTRWVGGHEVWGWALWAAAARVGMVHPAARWHFAAACGSLAVALACARPAAGAALFWKDGEGFWGAVAGEVVLQLALPQGTAAAAAAGGVAAALAVGMRMCVCQQGARWQPRWTLLQRRSRGACWPVLWPQAGLGEGTQFVVQLVTQSVAHCCWAERMPGDDSLCYRWRGCGARRCLQECRLRLRADVSVLLAW
eukprot:1138887-Pelagomonas_calceolata.AAC.2